MPGSFQLNTSQNPGLAQVLAVNPDAGDLIDFQAEAQQREWPTSVTVAAKQFGTAAVLGYRYRVTFTSPGTASAPLAVTTATPAGYRDINVTLATNASSAITSTRQQVADAINAHATAGAWVLASATSSPSTVAGAVAQRPLLDIYSESDARRKAVLLSIPGPVAGPAFTEI